MRISDWSSDVCSSDLPEGEKQGVAEPKGDLLGDRAAAGPGIAEVALQGTAEPLDVADDGGAVEAELGADVGHRLRRRRLAEVDLRKVSWQRLDAEEDHPGHRQQQQQAQAQALDDQRGQRHVMAEAARSDAHTAELPSL